MATISEKQLTRVKDLYYNKGYSMQRIGDELGVSIHSVTYFMRRYKLSRRNASETNALWFERKTPSFAIRPANSKLRNVELEAMGSMLYWAEGYDTDKATGIDFANSDSAMVLLFMAFLRSRYKLDESKFRPYVYCYSNQNTKSIIKFWSRVLNVPTRQFIKPYVRQDYRENGRIMKHGLVHIRYHDKKLLLDIRNLIESYKLRYSI